MHNPKISCCSSSCKLKNLKPVKNFVVDSNAIYLTLMIPVSPFLTYQLSWFMTINLYGGAHESEKSMVTQGDMRVLDRFGPPGG
jgi:hypothetical protein